MDVSPKQLVSVAASLIPFLENDDANRALMGSNMQRQAVPLLRAEAPLCRHRHGARHGARLRRGRHLQARRRGGLGRFRAHHRSRRRRRAHEGQMSREVGADIYQLTKFKRSNQNTCISQKPIVIKGQRVRKGDVLADGPCTDIGELALGRNVLVAFMPWRGYNFEDAIVVSAKSWSRKTTTPRSTSKSSKSRLATPSWVRRKSRAIFQTSRRRFLRNLDESGIIRVGATVKPGDILVGKVTPKGETQLTPEEKLLRAIFGEKAGDVKDASLYCPPGIEGTVVDCKVFSRKGAELDERSEADPGAQEERPAPQPRRRKAHPERRARQAPCESAGGKEVLADLHDEKTNKKLRLQGRRF